MADRCFEHGARACKRCEQLDEPTLRERFEEAVALCEEMVDYLEPRNTDYDLGRCTAYEEVLNVLRGA